MGVAADLVIILLAATLIGFASLKLGVPLIIAYLVTGIVIGPNTGGITVGGIHEIEMLAEIGVALLLFALGLELSFDKLKSVRNVAIFGTALQMLLCIAYGWLIGTLLGWDEVQSLWLGSLISLSSTMVILKTLMAQGRMGTLSSRVMIGMLVAQDIAVVPLIIALPKLHDPVAGAPLVALAFAKAALFIAVMIVLGTRLLPRLFHLVAGWRSREFFLLVTTSLALGIGYGTYKLGLSFAFGAFVAGMVLGETEFGHQALSDVVPLRDVFGLLFFTSIGMLLDPALLLANLGAVATLTLLVVVGKMLVFAAVTRLFGYSDVVPLAVGLALFQVGEFSFVLGRIGVDSGALSEARFSLFLSSAVLTMILTPFVSGLTTPLYALWRRLFGGGELRTVELAHRDAEGHVVIAGGGRVGLKVAKVLREFGVEALVIEADYRRFMEVRGEGFRAIYGDASQKTLLAGAGVERAALVVLTIPALAVGRAVVRNVRELNEGVRLIARSEGEAQMASLCGDGVDLVILPEVEAGIELTRQALLLMDFDAAEVQNYADRTRSELYDPPGGLNCPIPAVGGGARREEQG